MPRENPFLTPAFGYRCSELIRHKRVHITLCCTASGVMVSYLASWSALAGFWHLASPAHQGVETCTVFAGQPVGQFSEHDTINIAVHFGFKINKLIEHSPAF